MGEGVVWRCGAGSRDGGGEDGVGVVRMQGFGCRRGEGRAGSADGGERG